LNLYCDKKEEWSDIRFGEREAIEPGIRIRASSGRLQIGSRSLFCIAPGSVHPFTMEALLTSVDPS